MDKVIEQTVNETEFQRRLTVLIPKLRRFAGALTGSTHDRDDLVQTTLTRAIEKRDQWQTCNRLEGWLFSILHSIWKNELRSRAVRRGNGLVDPETLKSDWKKPDLDAKRNLQTLRELIAQLPEAQRAAVVLIDVEGMSYKEAAGILDIPAGTLMSRLSRARKTLIVNFSVQNSRCFNDQRDLDGNDLYD